MSPSEREFGRLEGKVDELGRRMTGVESGMAHMRESATAEHAEVRAQISKAVTDIRGELNPLQVSRSERIGRDAWVKGAFGAAIALVGLFLTNGGHL